MPWASWRGSPSRHRMVFELQAHPGGGHRGDVARAGRRPASWPSRSRPRAAGESALLSTIRTAVAFSGWSCGERRRAVDRRGDAQPAQVDSLPRPFGHLPGHHGPIAVDEDLGIGEARAGEDIGGACLDIVAPNARRARQRRRQGQEYARHNAETIVRMAVSPRSSKPKRLGFVPITLDYAEPIPALSQGPLRVDADEFRRSSQVPLRASDVVMPSSGSPAIVADAGAGAGARLPRGSSAAGEPRIGRCGARSARRRGSTRAACTPLPDGRAHPDRPARCAPAARSPRPGSPGGANRRRRVRHSRGSGLARRACWSFSRAFSDAERLR